MADEADLPAATDRPARRRRPNRFAVPYDVLLMQSEQVLHAVAMLGPACGAVTEVGYDLDRGVAVLTEHVTAGRASSTALALAHVAADAALAEGREAAAATLAWVQTMRLRVRLALKVLQRSSGAASGGPDPVVWVAVSRLGAVLTLHNPRLGAARDQLGVLLARFADFPEALTVLGADRRGEAAALLDRVAAAQTAADRALNTRGVRSAEVVVRRSELAGELRTLAAAWRLARLVDRGLPELLLGELDSRIAAR